jgi:tRNA (cytidine/uridine-2'-O-)-methyltransferase
VFHVVLVEPEIPPNTGNVIRLCANTGAQLHLIEPLGFPLDDARMRRAGLDYHEFAAMRVHATGQQFFNEVKADTARIFAFTTHGSAVFSSVLFQPGDVFVSGAETRGLDPELRDSFPPTQRIRLPMRPDNRSLNLSNAVAVVVFEAWRQHNFEGGARAYNPVFPAFLWSIHEQDFMACLLTMSAKPDGYCAGAIGGHQ